MRVSKEKAAEHRQQIVDAAARLFRERGIGATGVDSITREAGLTHGAVYSQFGSKEAIAIDSIRLALRGARRTWLRAAANKGRVLPTIVESYLSARHRDAPGSGCVVAALGGDIARQPRSVRDAFTDEFKQALEFLADVVATDDRLVTSDDALAAFASMAGGLMLARAVSDPALSDRILKATSAWVKRKVKATHPRRARVISLKRG
jgi:TetR/AcrR family transcriptional regulator, transcriptional repressor for nem operon